MRGYFIHQDCFDFTGNYTPNTTTKWLPVFSLGYQIKMKECNMQPLFWEHLKMTFTVNMIVFKKKKKRKVSLDGCSDNCQHFDKEMFKNIILPEKADYSSNDFTSTGLMKKPKRPALEDLFLVHSLLPC